MKYLLEFASTVSFHGYETKVDYSIVLFHLRMYAMLMKKSSLPTFYFSQKHIILLLTDNSRQQRLSVPSSCVSFNFNIISFVAKNSNSFHKLSNGTGIPRNWPLFTSQSFSYKKESIIT